MEVELIKLIPSLLWFLFVATLFGLFYRPVRDELLPNLTSFKVGGVELSFVRGSIDAAIKLAEKSADLEFLEQLQQNKATPVIFYIGVFDLAKGVPARQYRLKLA